MADPGNDPVWRDAVEASIKRRIPDVEAVEFDDDGEHVYVAVAGEDSTRRYRLGTDAKQVLAGEFDGEWSSENDPLIHLLPPRDDEAVRDG